MIFDNVVSRYKDRKINLNMVSVGMDAYADPAGRSNARSPFDGNVVCDFDRMVPKRKKRKKRNIATHYYFSPFGK